MVSANLEDKFPSTPGLRTYWGEILPVDITRISWTPRMGPRASAVALYPIPGHYRRFGLCGRTTQIKPMTIPSLSEFASGSEDRLLCPVRALWHYLKRTESTKRPSNRLFVIVKRGGQAEVSALTFSAWSKNLISFSYLSAPKRHDV